MKKQNNPLGRKEDIVVQELDGEVLIYDLNKNKAFCLNETSALVWKMCDGNKSVSEISEGISKKLNLPANEDLVWLAIDQLKKEKLILNSEELESKFEGMSRREVIKKIGLGTMIALPIVAGLVAPTSAHAASVSCTPGAPLGQGGMGAACFCITGSPVGTMCGAGVGLPCKTGCSCTVTSMLTGGGTCQ